MLIDSDRLRQNFSEGGAQEIYQAVKAQGDFLDFTRRFAFSDDHRVARSALWGLTKASTDELQPLKVLMNDLIDQALQTPSPSVRRLTLSIVYRLPMEQDELRTDFLDFCLQHMLDVEEEPGIQTLCMKLAHRMCAFYPELTGEFRRTLEAMRVDFYKTSVKGLRNKLLYGKSGFTVTHRRKKAENL